jgi:hypothetical protein
MVRCDAAVAEKPAGEEAAEEKFEYQAEVRHGQTWPPCLSAIHAVSDEICQLLSSQLVLLGGLMW